MTTKEGGRAAESEVAEVALAEATAKEMEVVEMAEAMAGGTARRREAAAERAMVVVRLG